MFIGRKKELEYFQEKWLSEKAELIVLYGRRRIGKTELLKEFCKDKEHVFYSCRECMDELQLKSFSSKILVPDHPASRYLKEFASWEQAFSSLSFSNGRRRLIIIDEFPYMCRGNTEIPSILQNLWDHQLKDEDIMIVLCGSSMSFIEKEILSEKNPLYGRATGILKLSELSYKESAEFFPNYCNEDKLAAYAVLGGIPHYLKQFDSRKSLKENIIRSILRKGSILYSEVEFLLRQELRETAAYNSLIEAVALGCTTLGDICSRTMMEKSKASVYLYNLIELGILEREFSIDEGASERSKRGRGIYRITCSYFKFWYRFVFPNISELEDGDEEGVYSYVVEPHLQEYVSFAFEEVCREYVKRISRRGRLDFRIGRIGRWWGKVKKADGEGRIASFETEIDLVAFSSDRKHMLIGECKYRNSPVDIDEYKKLKDKQIYDKGADVQYAMFSKSGFGKRLEELAEAEGVLLVSLEDIYDE